MPHSKLEALDKKLLCHIAERLLKKGFDPKNPFEDIGFKDSEDVLGDITNSILGEEYNAYLDVDFMGKFILLNSALLTKWSDKEVKFNEIQNKFIIPQIKMFKVDYEIWGPATFTERYVTEWPSYDETFVKSSIQEAHNDGRWSSSDGNYID